MIESGRHPRNTSIATNKYHDYDTLFHHVTYGEIHDADEFNNIKHTLDTPIDVSKQINISESKEYIPEIFLNDINNSTRTRTKTILRLPYYLYDTPLELYCETDCLVIACGPESLKDFRNLRILCKKPIELVLVGIDATITHMPQIVFAGRCQYIEFVNTIPDGFKAFLKKYDHMELQINAILRPQKDVIGDTYVQRLNDIIAYESVVLSDIRIFN